MVPLKSYFLEVSLLNQIWSLSVTTFQNDVFINLVPLVVPLKSYFLEVSLLNQSSSLSVTTFSKCSFYKFGHTLLSKLLVQQIGLCF